jgi:kanamycin kinase
MEGRTRTAVIAIAEGLRAMHDAMPVDECPFTWSLTERLASAHAHREAGGSVGLSWEGGYPPNRHDVVLRRLADAPPDDLLVVCHGDPCSPNTLIGDDGRWTAHVDLDTLGVADRWADLAVASWSLTWNFDGDWQQGFFDAYGIEPDRERIDYYRLLWEMTP